MPLSHEIITVLTCYEQHWYTDNKLPTVDKVVKETGFPRNEIRTILASLEFQEACANRGIDVNTEAKLLTPTQLALANTLLDFSDMATPAQKLKRLGVSPRQYSAWMKQKAFADYLRTRSEELFSDALPEAHAALVRNLQNGDVSSIKLFYEISGRWSSKTAGEVNIEFLMMKILDILYRYISDPETLRLIANELGALANPNVTPIRPELISTPPVGEDFS
jgi:DNA-binding transcriptional MerR regulator